MTEETVELKGHFIDSLLLPKVLDRIQASGGDYEIEQIDIGVQRSDPSYARIRIRTENRSKMERLLSDLKIHGARAVEAEDARFEPSDREGAFPEGFHATTNLPTQVRIGGDWIQVQDQEMDGGIVVDPGAKEAFCTPIHRIRAGDLVVVGHRGVRIARPKRGERAGLFEFMESGISPEKPKPALVHEAAHELWKCRSEKKKTIFVGGPAIIHTGGAEDLAYLLGEGFLGVLMAGNGLAVHDIENALFGTSLGVRLKDGTPVPGGHRNHLRAINAIRRIGGIRAAVESGMLTCGVMHSCITRGIPFVLAGSIRDDGPLPDVITDVIQAVDTMRHHVRGASLALMVASTLHAVAVGNILPADVRMVTVDISPASLTKLKDRGSFQTTAIVSDSGLFLREVAETLRRGW